MFIKRAKYEVEKLIARQRIEYLENLICPNEKHTYENIDYHFYGGTGHGDELTIYHYRCAKCGKYRETYKILN